MNTVLLRGGQRLVNVHRAATCRGLHCPIHRPSEHEYRDWDQHFNGYFMERVGPVGEVVRDPDDPPANIARCDECGDVIESLHRHDFRSCACGALSVDGGRDYLRRLGAPGAKWTELTPDMGRVAA